MNGRHFQQTAGGGYGGLTGPVPRDVLVLLGVVLFTFSLRFFESSAALHGLLTLSSGVWRQGFLWQIGSYLFAGVGAPGFWFLLELLILFMFSRTVFFQLGRRGFWRFLLTVGVACASLAIVVDLLGNAFGAPVAYPFVLMQGQHMLLTLVVAAFATMNRDATILLMFVLPVQAKWFLALTVLAAFMGYLQTGDLPGFLGLTAGVGLSMLYLGYAPARRGSGRRLWLRLEEWWLRRRLDRMRRRRGLRLVEDDDESNDDWVH